jgi:ribose 5-phosphate isomerase B
LNDDLIVIAAAHSIRSLPLPIDLFDDLISAFAQDTTTKRYDSWTSVLDYCRRSANPVGRLVLRIAGYRDDRLDRSSDALCTALQLTNFWQDFGRDWRAGRLYVPREVAAARGVRIVEVPDDQVTLLATPEMTIAIGADHGGYRLKEALKTLLESLGLAARDVGVYEEKAADYPDIAHKVAELVAGGQATRGVVIDGAGIGSCMAANKVPGIRAALCYDKASAKNGREHNDSNVLTLGARLLTQTQAEEVLRTWLATPFAGGRHQARVDKIMQIERQYREKASS